MKRVAVPAVLAISGLLCGADPAAAQAGLGEVDIYAGVDTGIYSSRLIADSGDARLLWTAVGDTRRPTYHAVGLNLPWAALGPLETGGLVRQLGSPLEYSAGSTVWMERPGLRLFTERERTSRFGVFVSGANGGLGAGVFYDGRTVPHLVATAGAGQGSRLKAGLVAEFSTPAREEPDEAWFPGDGGWPGGSVLHAGAESAFQSDSLHVAVSGLVSRPDRLRPGAVLHAWAGCRLQGLADLNAFAGCGTPEYRTPAGERIDRILRASCDAKLRPLRNLELRGSAGGDCPRGDYGRAELTEQWLAAGATLKSKWVDGRVDYSIGGTDRELYLGLENDSAGMAWRAGGELAVQAGNWTVLAGGSLDAEPAGLDFDLKASFGGSGRLDVYLSGWRRVGGAQFKAGLGLDEAPLARPELLLRRICFKLAWEYRARGVQAADKL